MKTNRSISTLMQREVVGQLFPGSDAEGVLRLSPVPVPRVRHTTAVRG